MKKENGKHKIGRALCILAELVLLLIVVVSFAMLFNNYMAAKRAEDEYRRLSQAVQITEAPEPAKAESESETEPAALTGPETEPYVSPIDFGALRQTNPDVVGWIQIPDTRIDYPIVQTTDNDKYLHVSLEGADSPAGTIFLDCDSAPSLDGRNNVIYGHHMKNGSMFKDVVKFKDPEFFKTHRFFQIYTPEKTIRLKTVSCYYAKAREEMRRTWFQSQAAFDRFVREVTEPCTYAEPPEASVPSLYMLITCSYEIDDARTFLMAVEVDEEGNIVTLKEAGASDSEPQG